MTKIHHGAAGLGIAVLAGAAVAASLVIRRRRRPDSPQWPLLSLAAGIGLNGLRMIGICPDLSSIASYLVVWFSLGAACTQCLDESTRPQPARRLR